MSNAHHSVSIPGVGNMLIVHGAADFLAGHVFLQYRKRYEKLRLPIPNCIRKKTGDKLTNEGTSKLTDG